MDFNLERSKAHAIKNLNYSNNLHEKLELMAEELDEKYDEIEELKQEIEKLKQENQKLKQQKKDKVNRDLDQITRWIRKSNEDYDDWFLPSIYQLQNIYDTVGQGGGNIGNFENV